MVQLSPLGSLSANCLSTNFLDDYAVLSFDNQITSEIKDLERTEIEDFEP